MAKRVTLQDVARYAGVTAGTASKAISGAPHVRQETRARVIAAAELLKYVPNASAQSLKSGRTYMVGLITSDAEGRFTVPVILGAERSLATGQIAILFADARDDPILERHWIELLTARHVDGFIVTSHRSDPRASITDLVSVPMVYAYSPSRSLDDVSVVPDDRHGGQLAGEHLLNVGRRRIAYIGGPRSYQATRLRRQGLEDVLAAEGLSIVSPLMFAEWDEKAGRRAARALLQQGLEFDAVFCASDQIARGVSEELQRNGVKVPTDVSIVGFDNWSTMVRATDPELTSVNMSLELVGEIAATRLRELVAGAEIPPGIEYVPCELVVRGSSV